MNIKKSWIKNCIVAIVLMVMIIPVWAGASSGVNFYLDQSYDAQDREQISTKLIEKSDHAYFYVDDQWWENLQLSAREEAETELDKLSEEFDETIYPSLTATYGHEWKPGIDHDNRITILFHPMKGSAGGYFRAVNEYPKLQNPTSNEREMFYVNTDYLLDGYAKSLLAHEFTHLISFNQKEKQNHVQEKTWLNEARAEYAPTLLGYDQEYEGSNLQRRARTFLEHSSDSIIEWEEEPADYGALNLFTQYLVQHYGHKILVDSLHYSQVGKASLNRALEENGVNKDFSDIFTDWSIAVYINDCEVKNAYCYLNNNLSQVKVISKTNFLPLEGASSLSSTDQLNNWSAQWIRFIGGDGDLTLKFVGSKDIHFTIPYVVESRSGETEVKFLKLGDGQKGVLKIKSFSQEENSLTLIPSVQMDTTEQGIYPFYWEAQTQPRHPEQQQRQQLIEQLKSLQQQIKTLRVQLAYQRAQEKGLDLSPFEQDLGFGMWHNEKVKTLQIFLKSRGADIYPEGLITGNYLQLTVAAVKRFQERYAQDILAPVGLSGGTGYLGPRTRAKINQLLQYAGS